MNPRILLAAVCGVASYQYFGTVEAVPQMPGVSLDPERLRTIWSLAIAALPMFGPGGQKIAQTLIKLAGMFDRKIIADAEDWSKKLDGVRELSPVILDLFNMFRDAKAKGDKGRINDLGQMIENEIVRITQPGKKEE